MTPAVAIKTCFRKYIRFSGRASRPEFWWFVLFVLVVGAVITAVHGMIFGPSYEVTTGTTYHSDGTSEPFRTVSETYDGGPVGAIFSILTFLPLLAASWRRLHDTGRPGWMLLLPHAIALILIGLALVTSSSVIGLIAFVATLGSLVYVFIMLAQPSQPGPNKYGPNPNEVSP